MSIKEQLKVDMRKEFNKLLAYYGSKATMAVQLGITQQVVNNWQIRGRISKKMAAKVESVTKGKFKKHDLRPDVSWLTMGENKND
jgi:DNA-binding transcriptional regulator YdaS (Cro superfamily)